MPNLTKPISPGNFTFATLDFADAVEADFSKAVMVRLFDREDDVHPRRFLESDTGFGQSQSRRFQRRRPQRSQPSLR